MMKSHTRNGLIGFVVVLFLSSGSYLWIRSASVKLGTVLGGNMIALGVTKKKAGPFFTARWPSDSIQARSVKKKMTTLSFIYAPLIWFDERSTGAVFVDPSSFTAFY